MQGLSGKRSGVLQVRKIRPGGWTAAARTTFLLHLATTCNVKAACQAAGKNITGVYRLRARDPGFAREWEAALEQGYQHLEAELLRRALGDAVGEGLVDAIAPTPAFDIELALKLLAQRHRTDPQGRRQATRLRQPSPTDVLASLDRKLTAMEKRLGGRA